jgi:hypothetical protein
MSTPDRFQVPLACERTRSDRGGLLHLSCALLVGASLAACESTVLLGGDCLTEGFCVETGDGDGERGDGSTAVGGGDAGDGDGQPVDSGVDEMDAGKRPLDAGVTLDAEIPDAAVLPVLDAGPGTPAPALRNASFERVNGTGAGDLNFSAFRALDPWYVCLAPAQVNFVRVEQDVDGVTPRNGHYFVGFSYMYLVDLTVPIVQELASPLKAGQRYAFLVDLRAQSGANEQLGLLVRGGTNLTPCAFPKELAETDYLPDAQWTTRCITFTPDTDLTQLAFMPKNKNGIAVFNRFFIDNIRTDPSCQ